LIIQKETAERVQMGGILPRKPATHIEKNGFSSSAQIECLSSGGLGERVMRGELNEPVQRGWGALRPYIQRDGGLGLHRAMERVGGLGLVG
jgi:hypothetical protein